MPKIYRHMKANYLASILLALFTNIILAQTLYVTGTVNMGVHTNTLLYCGSGMELTSANANVFVRGGIRVNSGNLSITNNSGNNNFLLRYDSDAVYGKLDISTAIPPANVTGQVALEKMIPNHGQFVQQSFPFVNYTTANFASDNGVAYVATATPALCNTPASHHMYYWSNTELRWIPVMNGDTIEPTRYHLVSNDLSTLNGTYKGTKETFRQRPAHIAYSVTFPNQSSVNFGPTGNFRPCNSFSAPRYFTFISDRTYPLPMSLSYWSDPNYAKNLYQLGNPFTTNLDLSYIGINESGTPNDGLVIPNLRGIYYNFGSGATALNSPNGGVVRYLQANNVTNQFDSGDLDWLVIPPMQPFFIKQTSYTGSIFTFTDGLKTFRQNSKATLYGSGGPSGTYQTYSSGDTYQVTLRLVDSNGEELLNRTHVAVSDNYINGVQPPATSTDISNGWIDNHYGFYGLQELPVTGGIDLTQLNNKLYINTFNPSLYAKPIPLGFKTDPNNPGQTYRLKALLFETGKLVSNFQDPSVKFYFHDKLTNQYILIDDSFDYTFTQSTDTDTRFELFYGDTSLSVGLPSENLTTLIYENSGEYYVRFKSDWTKASIFVYTAVGQLVYSKENINLLDNSTDFLLPLNSQKAITYLIKIIGPNGEEVTEKIVR